MQQFALKDLFNFKPPDAKRHGWIDYAKGIAIILVVYRHVVYGIKSTGIPVEQWIVDGNNMFYSFRMPLFFFLSGLFFERGIVRKGESGFFVSRVNTLLYPYLLWAVIQISLQIIFSSVVNAHRTGADYLNILTQPRHLDQLWYLFALFNVTMLYLLVAKLFRYDKFAQVLISLALLAIAPLVNSISTLYDIALHYAFFCIGNLTASYFFAEKTQERLSSAFGLVLLLPVFVVCQFYFLHHQQMNLFLYAAIAVIGSLFTIMLSFQLAKYNALPILRTFGHYSLYIYLLHVPIVSVIRYFLIATPLKGYVLIMLLLLIFIAIFLSVIVYRLCVRMKMGFLFKGPFTAPPYNPQAVTTPKTH
ncbi:acyltransferase family protein [Chitinophaga rhizophila]|uniref:Acyltransferase n=1 Tax=Chitinophaga rhizophila TaxID=2866212 RepID=A0ABS7GJ76_9BACT|nr:acyltransferase [Chitinophaga rhizophila]MBW8686717.1 acyltransferase [Chitinophaga rhizophila]